MSDFGTEMKDLIVSNIGGTFPKTLERLAVWAETDKYKWKEDEKGIGYRWWWLLR